MKATFLMIFSFLISFATSASTANPDGSYWLVINKSCDGKQMKVSRNDRIHFGNGMFAHIYGLKDSGVEYCNQIQAFTRNIQTSSFVNDNYVESAFLSPMAVRTVCKKKQAGEVISDQSQQIQGSTQSMTLILREGVKGYLEWNKSPDCPKGTLRFDLSKE